MSKSNHLCEKCKGSLLTLRPGPGECIEICRDCDIRAATDYLQKGRGDGWIDVQCRLPTEDGIYEVCYEATTLSERCCGREWFIDGEWIPMPISCHLDIIYWMPLPKPPKDGRDD